MSSKYGQKNLHFILIRPDASESGFGLAKVKPEGEAIEYDAKIKYGLTRLYRCTTAIVGYPFYYDRTDGGFVRHSGNGTLTIGQYTTWDGPSGPALDTVSFMRASLVHDMLYDCIRRGYLPRKYRAKADSMMRGIAIEDGMPRFRAWYAWAGVRFAGWLHTR